MAKKPKKIPITVEKLTEDFERLIKGKEVKNITKKDFNDLIGKSLKSKKQHGSK